MIELVGILNITPDSFSDGMENNSISKAILKAQTLFKEGATIVDVGAESTRPGATPITWQLEINRLSGFIKHICKFNYQISLDTYHSQTVLWASKYLKNFIINDVTGFRDVAMRKVAVDTNNKVIISHLPKSSSNIQQAHKSKLIDNIDQVADELKQSVAKLIKAGLSKNQIIIDPGIGFGKTQRLNWQLLEFGSCMPEYPVMIGYSRKRFLGDKRMDITVNFKAGQIAKRHQAKYLRVHDVAGHASLTTS